MKDRNREKETVICGWCGSEVLREYTSEEYVEAYKHRYYIMDLCDMCYMECERKGLV